MGRRAVPPHRSLVVRLLATSMLIAICAIAATAWLTAQLTQRAVAQVPSRTLSADTDVYDSMIAFAATHDSWYDVDASIQKLAYLTDTKIVLTTLDRQVIAASSPEAVEVVAVSTVPTATVDPLRLDAGLARMSGGRIDPRAVGPYRLTEAERQLLGEIAERILDCLRDRQVHAEVVETPSGRPTVRLISGDSFDTVSEGCGQDDLLQPVGSEQQPLRELTDLVRDCVGGDLPLVLTATFIPQYRTDPPDPDQDTSVQRCLEDSRRAQLRPYVAAPALLFVAGPAAAPAPAVTMSTANTLRIAGTAGLILVLTVAATILVGGRLVRPLRLLTEAARAPVDQQQPVPVTTRDEIGYLATTFNDLTDRRRALEQQRKAMVNDIAHELRTPLTNIRTWLEIARDGAVEVDSDALDLLVEEAILLHHVVDDLRDIAAADAGNLRVYPEPTFIGDLLGQTMEAHRTAAEVARVRLELTGDDDLVAVVDPVRLRQIVGNLVANAIRHTPAGGTVHIRFSQRQERLVIEVTDTGTGIADEDLPKVFERFWRADASRSRVTGGSGLGLSIARQLARAHGGDLTATSRPDQGSTFTVDLPT